VRRGGGPQVSPSEDDTDFENRQLLLGVLLLALLLSLLLLLL
jgi:hypothetical protein